MRSETPWLGDRALAEPGNTEGDAVRVAVVAEWYPSPADPVHGIWAHRQAVAAAAAGAEVQVLALRRPVPPMSLARRLARVPPDVGALRRWASGVGATLAPRTADGIPVHAVPWLGPPRPLSYGAWGWWMAPSLSVSLDRLWAAWRFDVLHAHCLAPAGHAATRWLAGRDPAERPAFVVSGHGPDLFDLPDHSRLGGRAVRASLHAADLVMANSTWSRARSEQLAGRPLTTAVVHFGAAVTESAPAAPPPAAPPPAAPAPAPATPAPGGPEPAREGPRRLRLVTVAHLQERKHHHVVLRALARLPAAIRPDYVIVGDGERREALEALVDGLGVGERVRFLGQLPHAQAVAQAAAGDLFVMPGVQEPFGVAFVEAMGAGVPAVGARTEGGPQDIAAAGEGMLLVGADDDAELAALIARLDVDRAELARLGDAARVTVRAHFTWERCGEATVAAYALALRPRR